jgi:hypothetical protein
LRQFNNRNAEDPVDDRVKAIVNKRHKPMGCVRCSSVLIHAGTKKFPQGSNFGGDLGELLVAKETLEMYVCSECGHVEFFAFGD